MIISNNEYKKILFLTRTNISEARIKRLGKYFENFYLLVDRINKLNHPDLDRDWSLFDFEYIDDRIIFSENIQIISEEDIFKGTYTHKCEALQTHTRNTLSYGIPQDLNPAPNAVWHRLHLGSNERSVLAQGKNARNYLIQITGASGFCRRCNTQFFPELWWNHPLKNDLSYKEIKYGANIPFIKFEINEDYRQRLQNIGVDKRIIDKTILNIHSPLEMEKMLNTKMYDWNNPPPPSKTHAKLIFLKNIWETRPVLSLGVFSEDRYFFHRCGRIEKILFNERALYPWCPACFTKFIPAWDRETVDNYHSYISIETYGPKAGTEGRNNAYELINADEAFYLSVLGLENNPSIEDINITFRKLSKIYHPDTGGDGESFQEIVKAKNWLLKHLKK